MRLTRLLLMQDGSVKLIIWSLWCNFTTAARVRGRKRISACIKTSLSSHPKPCGRRHRRCGYIIAAMTFRVKRHHISNFYTFLLSLREHKYLLQKSLENIAIPTIVARFANRESVKNRYVRCTGQIRAVSICCHNTKVSQTIQKMAKERIPMSERGANAMEIATTIATSAANVLSSP
jgi:hypothetical protein